MNQAQPYMDVPSSHLASTQPYTSQGPPAENLPHYPQYHQPPLLQPGPTNYAPTSHSYPPYGYPNGVTSPQSSNQPVTTSLTTQVPAQILPLPAMTTTTPNSHNYVQGGAGQPQPYGSQNQPFDTTGQIARPGMKPRVTATLWEDEGSLCFQVEAKGLCVARREDNHMINGTKLLNVAGMTRGRRDGILKSEKTRKVVKIGPMHLKGVWIPFERALEFANKERITEQLYPLFVHNISNLLYHPANQGRANAVVSGTDRRRIEGGQQPRPSSGHHQPPPLHHHHSMHNQAAPHYSQAPSQGLLAHPSVSRPTLDRAHTFPAPPTNASSLVPMGNQGNSYEWNGQNMPNNVHGPMDPSMGNTRSLPTTPSTTPPGANLQGGLQNYPPQANYDGSKSYYSSGPPPQSNYAPQHPLPPQNIPSQGNGQINHGSVEGEPADQGQDAEYINDTNPAYNASRGSYGYPPNHTVGSIQGEHAPLPSEMAAPSPHQNGTDRLPGRPNGPSQWTSNYPAPRPGPPSNLYSVMSDTRNSAPNGAVAESYPAPSTTPSAYSTSLNGSGKRGRDDDEQDQCSRPESRNEEAGFDPPKRRKTFLESGVNGPVTGSPVNLQTAKAGSTPRRR